MTDVYIKIISMISVIFIGYFLKKLGFFKKDDYKLIARIAINITLPASIISSFQTFKRDDSILFLVLLAITFNLILITIGWLYSKNMDDKSKSIYMLGGGGYNIGSFTLPYMSSLVGPYGVIATCLYDTGNAPFALGLSHAIASKIMKKDGGTKLRTIALKLILSPAFTTYIVMLVLAFAGLKLPKFFVGLTSYVGSSNSFLSMLMVGLMFEIEFERDYFKKSFIILVGRYTISIILASVIYFLTPLPFELRQILSILVFAPSSGLAPIFVDKLGGNIGLAGFISSMSIVISTSIMSFLILLMGLSN